MLALPYGWFRETADMWSKALSDRVALPVLDGGIDEMQRTWQRLDDEGLDDRQAADRMATTVG